MNRRDLFKLAGKVGLVALAQQVPWSVIERLGLTDDYLAEAAALPQNYVIADGTQLMAGSQFASYSIVSNPSSTGYVSSVTGPDGDTWMKIGLTAASASVSITRDLGAGSTVNIAGGPDNIYFRIYIPNEDAKKNVQIVNARLASGSAWNTSFADFSQSSTVKTGEQTGYLFNAAGDHSFMQDFSVRQLTNTLNKTAVRHISFQLTSTSTAGAEIWIKEIRYGVRTRPSIVFYFDDQHITQYTVAKPILDRYGLKSTLCISGNYLLNDQGSGIYMSEENVQTMFDAGHEVVSHSWNHGSYGSMTYQQIYDDAKLTKDLLDSRGWNRNGSEHLFTYANGSAPTEANMGALTSLGYTYARGARTYNVERYQQHTYGGVDYPMRLLTWGLSRPPRTITAMANNGSGAYRVTAAGHGFSSDEWVDISGTSTTADGTWQVAYVSSSQFDLVGPSFGSNATGVARQSCKEWERRVQMAIRFGATCHVLVHQVGAGGVPVDVGYVTDVEFDPFIQFCARHVQGNVLDWRTFPEWVNGLTNPRRTRY